MDHKKIAEDLYIVLDNLLLEMNTLVNFIPSGLHDSSRMIKSKAAMKNAEAILNRISGENPGAGWPFNNGGPMKQVSENALYKIGFRNGAADRLLGIRLTTAISHSEPEYREGYLDGNEGRPNKFEIKKEGE